MPSVAYLKKHAARTAAHRLARKRKRETERKRETQARQKWAHKARAAPVERKDFASAIVRARITRRLFKLAPTVRRLLRRAFNGYEGWSVLLGTDALHVKVSGTDHRIMVEPFGVPAPKVFGVDRGRLFELGDLSDWQPGAGSVTVLPSDPGTFERHMLSGQDESSELGDGA